MRTGGERYPVRRSKHHHQTRELPALGMLVAVSCSLSAEQVALLPSGTLLSHNGQKIAVQIGKRGVKPSHTPRTPLHLPGVTISLAVGGVRGLAIRLGRFDSPVSALWQLQRSKNNWRN